MRVVHVNASDNQGGAARAAYRLHRALIEADIDSLMLVQSKASDDNTVIGPRSIAQKMAGALRPYLDSVLTKFYNKSKFVPFTPAWVPLSGVVDRINALSPDLVHLHWIGNGMLRIEEISRINAPIIWTMHDSWAFTGGCHVRWECERHLSGCGACPVLGSKDTNDLSKKIFKRKSKAYSKIESLTVTGPSRWISNCTANSTLLNTRKVVSLPIPLNTHTFSPIGKATAKSVVGIDENKKYILFVAKSATTDANKGYSQLIDALNKLHDSNLELIVVGSSRPEDSLDLKLKTHYLGHIHDDLSLKVIYNAADVVVVPSFQETFGQTATESMSCGTPVVAFGTTGLLDIVDHKVNGYLAEPFSTDDLANGIEWILFHPDYETLSRSSRMKVLTTFDSNIVVKNYISVYKSIIVN